MAALPITFGGKIDYFKEKCDCCKNGKLIKGGYQAVGIEIELSVALGWKFNVGYKRWAVKIGFEALAYRASLEGYADSPACGKRPNRFNACFTFGTRNSVSAAAGPLEVFAQVRTRVELCVWYRRKANGGCVGVDGGAKAIMEVGWELDIWGPNPGRSWGRAVRGGRTLAKKCW
jgi:hypothetical protein